MDNRNMQPATLIAKIFGVTARRIEQLKQDGIIKGEGKPTKYDLFPTITAYIKYLSDKAYARERKVSVEELTKQKLQAEVDLKQAKAEAAQLELEELQGKMHRAEDVETITTDHVLFLRSLLMAMPGKLAVDCANTQNAAEVSILIQSEVYRVLDNLTNYQYDPEEYERRVRARNGWREQYEKEED